MPKSVCVAGVSVSVEELLPVVGSVPLVNKTFAVLARLPVAAASTVPLTVIVRKLPAPAGMLTPVYERLLPAEAFVPQVAVPLATQLIVVTVIAAGIVSTTVPVAVAFPLFLTVIE